MSYKIFKATLLATALVSGSALATDTVNINPDGAGPDSAIPVGSLSWAPGFAISVPTTGSITPAAVGSTFTTYGQGTLQGFVDPNGKPIGGTSLNTAYEWTYVFGFTETVTSASCLGGLCTANFTVTPGGTNFFNVYYDPSQDSNMLAGTGFTDGTQILTGSFLPYNPASGFGVSSFTSSSGTPQDLDQFGTNNYPGVTSVSGSGTSHLLASVTSSNPAFFLSPPTLINVTLNTFQNLPFTETDPSSCYYNGTSLSSAVGPNTAGGPCTVNTVGPFNGVTGPNVAFETHVTNAFLTRAVPEPAPIALLGLGLAIGGVFARRRTK